MAIADGNHHSTALKPALNRVLRDPAGQVALFQTEDRYLGLLTETFGRRFTEYRRSWAERGERGQPGDFPLSLDLAINSGCQLACLMCPLKSRGHQARLMDEALFRRLMDEAREHHLPALTLGLASEPLLNPSAAKWTRLAVRAGIMDIRLGTNGLALAADTARALIEAGLTRLEVSVDAARPETYRAIRGASFESLTRQIDEFLTLREAAGRKLPLLRLSFLKLPQNEGELPLFLARWQGKADMVSIQEPIWFPGSSLPPPKEPGRPIAPTCGQPWQRLAVDSGGHIWPCCSWYGETLLPKTQRTNLAEVWRSPEMAELRERLSGPAENLPPPCLPCRY